MEKLPDLEQRGPESPAVCLPCAWQRYSVDCQYFELHGQPEGQAPFTVKASRFALEETGLGNGFAIPVSYQRRSC